MNKDYTHITVVIDSSGSMGTIRTDTIGGFNSFLKEQQRAPGKMTLTQIHFSSAVLGVPPYWVKDEFTPVQDVLPLNEHTYVPGGGTPLLDSIGVAIVETGNHLARMKEEDKPGKVLMVIITDGQENASRTYSKKQIKEMVQHQTDVYKWDFIFLGANMDAIGEGMSTGFSRGTSVNWNANAGSVSGTFNVLTSKVVNYRGLVAQGDSIAATASLNYDALDRAKSAGEV